MRRINLDDEVAVLGAGTMGSGIAEVAARAGHRVRLFDSREGAAKAAVVAITGHLDRSVARGRLTADAAQAALARLRPVDGVAELEPCTLVLEAVSEQLSVKRELLRSAEEVTGEDTLFGTNTSSLSVTAIAAALHRPGQLVGLHFFNPAPLMPLVEVVRGAASESAALDVAAELVRDWGKTPVLCASTPGFVVNRIARPFYGEAQRLVERRAADPATIDAILREAGGFRMGPFELSDLVGQDVNFSVTRSVWEQTFHDPRYAPTILQRSLVDAGRLGRKTGRGVFTYADGSGPLDAQPHTSPPRRPPARVQVVGDDFGVMAAFLDRMEAGGVAVERVRLSAAQDRSVLTGLRLPGHGLMRVCDGGTARSWALEAPGGVVLLDWAHDPADCTRVALIAPRDVDSDVLDTAIGLCQAAGADVSVVGDVAGGVVARTVSMLVNEAVDLVARGEASATDVDVAMLLGTSYPSGPLEWGDRLGAFRIADVLGELDDECPTGRYRRSPRLDEAVVAQENLRDL